MFVDLLYCALLSILCFRVFYGCRRQEDNKSLYSKRGDGREELEQLFKNMENDEFHHCVCTDLHFYFNNIEI